jgi:hypothetical protein
MFEKRKASLTESVIAFFGLEKTAERRLAMNNLSKLDFAGQASRIGEHVS